MSSEILTKLKVFTIACSLFPVPFHNEEINFAQLLTVFKNINQAESLYYSLLPIPCSLFPVPYSLFPIPFNLLTFSY
jgi:hypothetical protein